MRHGKHAARSFRPFHEPHEPLPLVDVNDALDRIEADARAVLEAGGEVALRARLARLLQGDVGASAPKLRRQSRKGRHEE